MKTTACVLTMLACISSGASAATITTFSEASDYQVPNTRMLAVMEADAPDEARYRVRETNPFGSGRSGAFAFDNITTGFDLSYNTATDVLTLELSSGALSVLQDVDLDLADTLLFGAFGNSVELSSLTFMSGGNSSVPFGPLSSPGDNGNLTNFIQISEVDGTQNWTVSGQARFVLGEPAPRFSVDILASIPAPHAIVLLLAGISAFGFVGRKNN